VLPFSLDDQQQRHLAKLLGLMTLPVIAAGAIAAAIACYKATEAGSPDTTVGNILAELGELKKVGRAYDGAVRRLANERSGVDYTTHRILQPLATAVLAGQLGARETLSQAAELRAAELRQHPRVQTSKEPLRHFCGVLREIFHRVAAPELKPAAGQRLVPLSAIRCGGTHNRWHRACRFRCTPQTVDGIPRNRRERDLDRARWLEIRTYLLQRKRPMISTVGCCRDSWISQLCDPNASPIRLP
jgi:hypothetical protein